MSEGASEHRDEAALDRALRELVAEAATRPPEDSVDWTALRGRILGAADERLARVGGPSERSWYVHAARWTRVAGPVAVAAGVLLALTMPAVGPANGESGVSAATQAPSLPDGPDVQDVVLGTERVDAELLLLAAFGGEVGG